MYSYIHCAPKFYFHLPSVFTKLLLYTLGLIVKNHKLMALKSLKIMVIKIPRSQIQLTFSNIKHMVCTYMQILFITNIYILYDTNHSQYCFWLVSSEFLWSFNKFQKYFCLIVPDQLTNNQNAQMLRGYCLSTQPTRQLWHTCFWTTSHRVTLTSVYGMSCYWYKHFPNFSG